MTTPRRRIVPRLLLRPRDPSEAHRAASPLELFFDLVFVVAVSLASAQLHHSEAESHIASGVGTYLMLFFAIWWAWMNFTWFASAFDSDDWLYRVLTIIQMGGALVLAAGAAPAMERQDFLVVTIGYVIMRLALVTQWLRAALGDTDLRATALRYAGAITLVQILWVARLWLPEGAGLIAFFALVAVELAIPAWAERHRSTPWHPRHIAERYSLFTLIVLGESVLASTGAVADAAEHTDDLGPLLVIAVCGLVLATGMWWIYFSREHHDRIDTLTRALTFGYGHYVIFAAAGAFSAGIEVAIDHDTHETGLDAAIAAATLTVPVAVFILAVWWLLLRHTLPAGANVAVPALATALAAAALAPASLVIAAVLIVVIVVLMETAHRRTLEPGQAHQTRHVSTPPDPG